MGLFGEYTEEINQKELYANPCVVCCDPRNSKFRMEEIYCVSAFAILRFSHNKMFEPKSYTTNRLWSQHLF